MQILGPTPKPIARAHNLYHYQILLKYRFEDDLQATLNRVLELTQRAENIRTTTRVLIMNPEFLSDGEVSESYQLTRFFDIIERKTVTGTGFCDRFEEMTVKLIFMGNA